MVRESAMSVCPIPCPRRTSRDSAGVYTRVYMKRMSGEQTPTAVNIVLLKNRTLVNVFERVRNGGRGRVEFGREEVGWLTFFLPPPPPPSFFVLYNTSIPVERSSPRFNEEPM